MKTYKFISILLAVFNFAANAQDIPKKWATTGLKNHSFLYAGEWQSASFKNQKMVIFNDNPLLNTVFN